MNTKEIDGNTYAFGKMNALTQFHVARRLAPVLAAMGFSAQSLKDGVGMDIDIGQILGPVAEVVAAMKDEDVNYILFACLAVVRRQVGEKLAPILAGNNRMQYDDITMPTMLLLAVEVVKEDLGGFFALLPDVMGSPDNSPAA